MIDDGFILRVERLRDEVEYLKTNLRRQYRRADAQVGSAALREQSRRLAEIWMVEVATREDVRAVIDPEALADYNIAFQRLLTYSERRSLRRLYDDAIQRVLTDFRTRVVLPLKQRRGQNGAPPPAVSARRVHSLADVRSIFVGHSFAADDKHVVDRVLRLFELLGLEVLTGEKAEAELVSAKVRERIETADAFAAVFTRREKFSDRDEWATSTWIVDEKAYAFAKGKKLILIKQRGVQSIGGIQGDYEYIEFSADDVADLILRLLELFHGRI